MAWIYTTNQKNTARFTLGEEGERILACVGVNPSNASPEKLDRTMQSVKRIANYNGYDGWLMLNLYPQRATNPQNIHKRMNKQLYTDNLLQIEEALNTYAISNIWLAYGDLVETRNFLIKAKLELLSLLQSKDLTVYQLGSLTKKGNPRHPLYQRWDSKLSIHLP